MNKNEKGFTLAELLVVVAIIAVLVAISIPIFTSQLEKAKQAADLANIRAAYAEVMTAYIAEDTDLDTSISAEGLNPLKSNHNVWVTKDYYANQSNGKREYLAVVELSSDAKKWNDDKAYEPLSDLFTNDLGNRTSNDTYAVIGIVSGDNNENMLIKYTSSSPIE